MRDGKTSYSDAGKLGWLASKETHEKQKAERIAKYNENPKKCAHCFKAFIYKERFKKFCGHSCSAGHNNKLRGEIRTCKFCGSTLSRRRRKKVYCSNKCHMQYEWKCRKDAIESSGSIPNGSNVVAKRYLVETKGYKCELCSINEWYGKRLPLILDHISGNSDDWRLENLRLVCSNCDSLLPTYKSKNKGQGRVWRRKHYHETKVMPL